MNGSAVDSSASGYFWAECLTFSDDGDGAGRFGWPSVGILILFTTYCFEFLFGTPSNLWLVCHILRKRSKGAGVPPADFFPLHLSLTQLLFYPNVPLVFANHYLWQNNYVLGLMTFLSAMGLIMKPLLLTLVCLERYMAVVRPLDYLRFKTRWYKWGCVGASWCIYFLMAFTGLFKGSSILVCVLYVPVVAIDTFCSLSVLKTLQKPPPGDGREMEKKRKKGEEARNGMGEGTQEQGGREEERKAEDKAQRRKGKRNSMKKKAFITIVIIQAVLTFNYVPFIVTLPMDGRVPPRTVKCQYWAMAIAAAASCSFLQPLLYLYRLGRLPWSAPQNN